MTHLEKKVKPQRQEKKPNGEFKQRSPLPQKWWIHAEKRPTLYSSITGNQRVMTANAGACPYFAAAWMRPDAVYANTLNVFTIEKQYFYACLESLLHICWADMNCSTMKDDLRYTPTTAFETFPFPFALLDSVPSDPAHEAIRQGLESIGACYHQFRADLMVSNNEGLTSTYKRFHYPAETSSGLLELRRLHSEMDQAVLAAYGWSDVPTLGPSNSPCGFGLDYLDLDDDTQLPDELQERIDSGELFFWDAGDALDFQGQLQAYGAITGRRKLPWRYRWPDSVRDDVLARLLALNAERYAEEVALGLHSKGTKQPANAGGGGKRRGRPAKAIQGVEPEGQEVEQIGLGL